jgi:hypothetical protein
METPKDKCHTTTNGDPVIKGGVVGIPLTGSTPPYFCACPKPGPGLPTSYFMVFFVFRELRWEVIVRFVNNFERKYDAQCC